MTLWQGILFVLGLAVVSSIPIVLAFWLLYREVWRRKLHERRLGVGMAKKRSTWDIQYGIKPNSSRYNGYDETITARLIASTHDEAVALLKEYDPEFKPEYIIKSERGGLEYIVAEKNA
jgi:hypothetical protein